MRIRDLNATLGPLVPVAIAGLPYIDSSVGWSVLSLPLFVSLSIHLSLYQNSNLPANFYLVLIVLSSTGFPGRSRPGLGTRSSDGLLLSLLASLASHRRGYVVAPLAHRKYLLDRLRRAVLLPLLDRQRLLQIGLTPRFEQQS